MNVRGTTGLTLNWESGLDVTPTGASASVKWEAPTGTPNVLAICPPLYSAHPYYSGLVLKRLQIARQEAGKYTITGVYEGEVGGSPSGPAFDVAGTPALREVPIETHPKFTEWAGTYKAPKEGLFDDGGRFIGWQPTSKLFGVTSYLAPSIEVTITQLEPRVPDVTTLGTIVSSRKGLPRVGGKRNWMLVGMPYRTTGEGVSVSYIYLLSGKSGWDRRIYS